MEQQDEFNYTVKKGEVVTIVFTPIKVGPFAALAVDGTALTNIGGNTPTFRFTVTKEPGQSHFGAGRCDFPPGTPADAKYKTRLSASNGGDFTGPTILASFNEFDFVWNVGA